MDSGCIVLHYPNMAAIPTYALYGETEPRHDWLHWETIQARSRAHGYRIGSHRHEQFLQVLWLKAGHGVAWLDGRRFALRPGAMALVPALTVHSYAFSPDVDGIVVTIVERDAAALGVDLPQAEVMAGTPATVSAIEALLAEADQPGRQHDLVMQAHLTVLLVSLRRASRQDRAAPDGGDRMQLHARAFRQLVDRQFRATRRIGAYARALGISEAHLNRVSRQVLGASALRVIERRIAIEARRQLLFSDLSIKQIGADLGYDDPAYFTRFVTRVLGVSPGAVRREAHMR